jgi:predicted tellurium resistance membrane protein TerC
MSDLISGDVLSTLAQVVMIDLVLAGDNAVVIGLAAAGLPDKQRNAPFSSVLLLRPFFGL